MVVPVVTVRSLAETSSLNTSVARAGKFEVRGYAGNAGPDHVDHLHALDYFVRELERMR